MSPPSLKFKGLCSPKSGSNPVPSGSNLTLLPIQHITQRTAKSRQEQEDWAKDSTWVLVQNSNKKARHWKDQVASLLEITKCIQITKPLTSDCICQGICRFLRNKMTLLSFPTLGIFFLKGYIKMSTDLFPNCIFPLWKTETSESIFSWNQPKEGLVCWPLSCKV